MKKSLLLSMLGLIVSLSAMAQLPTRGKYYRIHNAKYNNVMKEDWGTGTSGKAVCATRSNAYEQMWEYTSSGALRNVYTGRYLQNQTSTSSTFTTGSVGITVTFNQLSDGHLSISTSGSFLHCDAAMNVVRWQDTANEGNHWSVEEVSLSEEEVSKQREEYTNLINLSKNVSKYSETLKTFFTTELCNELKGTYAAMGDSELKAAMAEAGLPASLQEIGVKIKNGWWNETSQSAYADANKYAKDFRVATYGPHTDANNWCSKILMSYQPSYMGNPTGIYATNKEVLHVFVGSDIPENATLYLTPVRNHGRIGSRTEGTELKKGYNVVVAGNDSLMYFVNYVVNTVSPSNPKGSTIAKVSDFPALDIHIEGGQCVGYYQKPAENSSEEDAKYRYLSSNANNDMYFVVRGEATLFYFRKQTYVQTWPKTIWNSINWFDRVRYWQFGVIGVTDDVANGLCESGTENSRSGHPMNLTGGDAFWPTYFNNPSMAIEGASGQNPHASGFYTSYPGTGGVESSFNAERANFDNWCCGHEHGHTIQAPYNLESCTESSVNLGANLITYLSGYRLSRGWNFANSYKYTLQQVPFGQRDISITLRMYWNLFLYYHVAGKKKDFYPTFVKSLREDPMDFSTDGWYDHPQYGSTRHHRATKTWIKLYKKACEAAQEDLTEYFRMWGFFVPCDKAYFGDYTSYYVSLTQQEIDAAIAEVKAKKYPENLQIIFIEDRQILRPRTDIWASSATSSQKNKPDNGGSWRTQEQLQAEYGNVGDVLTFIDGSANTSKYTYIASGNKITMRGEGGAGFIVYDKNGNIAFMSNSYEFTIPSELALDGFTIKAVNADGSATEVPSASDNASDEEKLAILQAAISMAGEYTALEDPTGKRVGFYSTETIATLKALVADAKSAIAAGTTDSYISLAEAINSEVLRLQSGDMLQKIQPTTLYNITAVRKVSGGTRHLNATSAGAVNTIASKSNTSRWALAPTGEENTYYIQNRGSGKMIGAVLNDKGKVSGFTMVDAKADEAWQCRLKALGNGIFCLKPTDNSTNMNMSPTGELTVWGSEDEGSQWYITGDTDFDDISEEILSDKIKLAKDLMDDVCEYTVTQVKYELQSTSASQAGYISTNQPDASRPSNQIDKAIDDNTTTFFISNRSNNSGTQEPHHIKVDLGSGKTSKSLQFYMYGNSTWNYATAVSVYGSTNGTSWKNLCDISGMPVSYTSDIIAPTTAYRYWRFDVTATTGRYTDTSAYPWFTVKEFAMYESTGNFNMKPGFESIGVSYLKSCRNNIIDAENTLAGDFKTPLGMYLAYSKLHVAYNNLYSKASAIDPTVDINDVQGENGNGTAEVYDLSGRRMKKAGSKGVYIIGGKKVIR